MSRRESVVWCDNCGVEITWTPLVVHLGGITGPRDYCCDDCYHGFLCECGDRMENDEEYRDVSQLIMGNTLF